MYSYLLENIDKEMNKKILTTAVFVGTQILGSALFLRNNFYGGAAVCVCGLGYVAITSLL